MADDYTTANSTSGVVWTVVGIAAVALAAWLVWAAMAPSSPGIPNTGTETQTQTPAQ